MQLLHVASLTSPGFMDKLASVQPGFWYKNRALIPNANIDFSRTVSLRPGVEGTQTSPAPRPAPHTCCGWRPYLLQHQLEMSVWGAGKPAMHRAHGHTLTQYIHIYTDTHSSLFHLQPRVFGSLTGAAFLVSARSHANGLSNLGLNFYAHTPTHTTTKQATRPNWHIRFFKTSI